MPALASSSMNTPVPAALLGLASMLLAAPCPGESLAIEGARGVRAALEIASGRYEVRTRDWTFAGTLGAVVSESSVHQGRDQLGPDQASGRFDFAVSPGPNEPGESPRGDPVREAVVSLRAE